MQQSTDSKKLGDKEVQREDDQITQKRKLNSHRGRLERGYWLGEEVRRGTGMLIRCWEKRSERGLGWERIQGVYGEYTLA